LEPRPFGLRSVSTDGKLGKTGNDFRLVKSNELPTNVPSLPNLPTIDGFERGGGIWKAVVQPRLIWENRASSEQRDVGSFPGQRDMHSGTSA
jgi:hypothetical protein